jgi:CheY-like chemotaxis protein
MAPASHPGHSFSVLVADDEAANSQSLARWLRLCGFEVATVPDGQAACEWARQHRPDVIIMDLAMPIMGGLEAARRIRELPSSRRPFLIAMTAWDAAQIPDRARAAGFDLHVLKPAEPVYLESLLRRFAAVPHGSTA